MSNGNGLYVFAQQTQLVGSDAKKNDLYIRHDANTTDSGLSFGDDSGAPASLRISYQDNLGATIKTEETLTLDAKNIAINDLEKASSTNASNYNYVVMDASGNLLKGERYFITINDTIDVIQRHIESVDIALQDFKVVVQNNQKITNDKIDNLSFDLVRTNKSIEVLATTVNNNEANSNSRFRILVLILIGIIALLLIGCIILIIVLVRSNKNIGLLKNEVTSIKQKL
jgi:hypothetical protein